MGNGQHAFGAINITQQPIGFVFKGYRLFLNERTIGIKTG